MQTHKEAILMYFDLRDNIKQVVKEYVQDTSIDLDERWRIFERSGFGENPSWIQCLKSLHDDICTYDGLVNVDRHQQVSVFEIVERYNEDKEDFDVGNTWAKNYLEWQKYKFDPVAFKEECLAKFIKGWKYDW